MGRVIFIVYLIFICTFSELIAQRNVSAQIADIESQLYYYPELAEKKLIKLNQKISIAQKNKYKNEIQLLDAFLFYQKGKPDSALITIKETLTEFIINDNSEGQAKCHLIMAWISEGVGYWEQAIVNYYKCINFLDDRPCIYSGIANIGIARCNGYLKKDYTITLNKGVKQLKEYGSYPHQLFAEYSFWSILKSKESGTIQKLKSIADNYIKLNLNNKAANIYRRIGHLFQQKEELDSAEYYVDKALSALDDDFVGIAKEPGILQLKGALRYLQNDIEGAENYLYLSIESYDKYGLHEKKYYPYKLLCRIDTINNNYNQAFEHLSKATKYQNLFTSKQKQRLALVLEISAEVDTLKEDITTLKWQRTTISLIAIIGFLLSTLLVYYLINLYKKRQRKIRAKNRELQALVVGMNEKILMQKRLGVEVETIPKSKVTIKTISTHFDICYRETYQTFLSDYQQLSKADARYALMFALGMSTDAICQIQSVQKSTVRKAKFRIREKLNLDTEVDLEQFFKPSFERSMALYQC
ncbi:hypothetical protein [Carboxylicivirga sp. M1479]|uniref:helix-turn-helix transcriptional regulator n=1 Tax=Carboxylicivirga sp. M1479 TaxID=2594476 RepID=UPI001178335E|nr:hypothetical protein [Carboxylicivirga sp. M1479]TRX66407.1 hypothetical protein FNN09_13660 [Carboxylicivirga sp. M1479]